MKAIELVELVKLVKLVEIDIDIVDDMIILDISLVHEIFEYIDVNFKLLIHKEGSSDAQKSKRLSIETIMRSGLEDYFKDVLLCDRLKKNLCFEAAKGGHITTLKWARQHSCNWNSETCRMAAKGGHLDCLIWSRENGCTWSYWTCFSAAMGGHLDCLIWAREQGCDWNSSICWGAALNGHLDCMIWSRDHGCDWDPETCKKLARRYGQDHILSWIAAN